jgi:diacylglycerol kinase (ATP)
MPLRKWIDSANNAIEGILHAAKTQRHLRCHFYSTVAVLVLSYILGVERTDFLIISIAVILVLLAEMINTAIEYVVDMISPEHSEKARIAKDVAAGAVFITVFGAAILGYIILFPYLVRTFETGIHVVKHSREDITLIAIILILISVVVLKALFGRGHPLRGGMPSGHSAIAFSAWVAVTYITENFMVSMLSFALAVLLAQSRIAVRAHTALEVIVGAVLGAGITFLLFIIFY